MTETYEPGTTLTCTNDDCPCQLTLDVPCPHGDQYTCACGHPLVRMDAPRDSIGSRVEEAGIVDQQAVLLDEIEQDQAR